MSVIKYISNKIKQYKICKQLYKKYNNKKYAFIELNYDKIVIIANIKNKYVQDVLYFNYDDPYKIMTYDMSNSILNYNRDIRKVKTCSKKTIGTLQYIYTQLIKYKISCVDYKRILF